MYLYVFLDLKNIYVGILFVIINYLLEEIWECIHLAAILDTILDFTGRGIIYMALKYNCMYADTRNIYLDILTSIISDLQDNIWEFIVSKYMKCVL